MIDLYVFFVVRFMFLMTIYKMRDNLVVVIAFYLGFPLKWPSSIFGISFFSFSSCLHRSFDVIDIVVVDGFLPIGKWSANACAYVLMNIQW